MNLSKCAIHFFTCIKKINEGKKWLSEPCYFEIFKYISNKSVHNTVGVLLCSLFSSLSKEKFMVYDISALMYNIICLISSIIRV